jgi:hypothetical protein
VVDRGGDSATSRLETAMLRRVSGEATVTSDGGAAVARLPRQPSAGDDDGCSG